MIYSSLLHKFLHILPHPRTATINHLSQQKIKSLSPGLALKDAASSLSCAGFTRFSCTGAVAGHGHQRGTQQLWSSVPTRSFCASASTPSARKSEVWQRKSVINQADMDCGENLVYAIFHLKAHN